MEIKFTFVKNPNVILIYNFKENKLSKISYSPSISYNLDNGNYRIYCWPYKRFKIKFRNKDKERFFLNFDYGYYINNTNNNITLIDDSIKFKQSYNIIDFQSKNIIRYNYYWYNLHYFFYNYYPANPSESDKNQVIKLFNYMANKGLVCIICRTHFRKYTTQNPYLNLLDSNKDMFKYTVDLHNNVNRTLHKKKLTINIAYILYEKSQEFETKLNLVCKPMFEFFNEGNLDKFPEIINNNNTLGII
tara:strand:- start:175 stop:912 length:738 start_codon:yes stop_codon:yes gene_type:complete